MYKSDYFSIFSCIKQAEVSHCVNNRKPLDGLITTENRSIHHINLEVFQHAL